MSASGLIRAAEDFAPWIGKLAVAGADDADLFFEEAVFEQISLEEGRVKHLRASEAQGMSARIVVGDAQAVGATDRITPAAIEEAIQAARAIAATKSETKAVRVHEARPSSKALYPAIDPASEADFPERRKILEEVDRIARASDPRVVQVFASLSCALQRVTIVRLDGRIVQDTRPLVRLDVSVVVEQKGRRETGTAGGGGRFGLRKLLDAGLHAHFAREAVRIACLNLEAIEAPAGPMPVVLGSGWPGILLHEAVGHGLEADFNRKGTSVFSGRIGERVAAKGVTVVDDGTLPERRGSITVDDEGTPSQRTVLIEDGVLVGYLCDRQNARLLGMQPTGNGRRESFAHPVLPRMTNTFMLAGNDDPNEILASLDRGLYAVNFGGGQVDITSGQFVFTTSEAYWVEKGRIVAPVKKATLIGAGHEVLKRISMIGNDLKLDPGVGTCGKDGQSVPVGVGLPTVRVDELTIGGTKA